MLPPNIFDSLIQNMYGQLQNSSGEDGGCEKNEKITLTPSQLLVVAGLLGGVFQVISVLVDKDQTVQIVLSGSLKRKTEMDKMLDSIGSMSFDDVMKAIIEHFS